MKYKKRLFVLLPDSFPNTRISHPFNGFFSKNLMISIARECVNHKSSVDIVDSCRSIVWFSHFKKDYAYYNVYLQPRGGFMAYLQRGISGTGYF